MKRTLKGIIKALAALLLVSGFLLTALPFSIGIVNKGILLPNLLCLAGILYMMIREIPALKKKKGFQVVDKMMITIFCVGVGVLLVVSLVMGFGFTRYDGGRVDVVVVPGAKLWGDAPSRMLRERLDEAYRLLDAHPEAVCVVTGGQGADEIHSEAEVMKNYLVERGIAPSRVYEEDRAVNTRENFINTKALIEQNRLGSAVTVTTDLYHTYRCLWYAKQAGLTANGSPGKTQLVLVPSYWLREIFAVLKAWVGF